MECEFNPSPETCLAPTTILDFGHPLVKTFLDETGALSYNDPVQRAKMIYYAVRDRIWYDPYSPFHKPEHYRAGNVVKAGRGYCVPKASLLCALGRAVKMPSRIGFATVKNHLATKQLIEHIGTDLFVYHGYVEFFLGGTWVKATPAFNKELCLRHDVVPLDFNGRDDSIFQLYNLKNKRFMEYVEDHGTFSDIPVEKIVNAWEKAYGKERVTRWIQTFEQSNGKMKRDFYSEDVIRA